MLKISQKKSYSFALNHQIDQYGDMHNVWYSDTLNLPIESE